MRLKAFAITILLFLSVFLTGCDYDNHIENINKINEFIYKILYFYQGENGGNGGSGGNGEIQQIDYLESFASEINKGKKFIIDKTAQSESYSLKDIVYYCGDYIYIKTTQFLEEEFNLHKLYLKSGVTYKYIENSLTQGETVNFMETKTQILNELFGDLSVYTKIENGYEYKNNYYSYYLTKGKSENSLDFVIEYSSPQSWVRYNGTATLFDSLSADMPNALRNYI